MPFQSSYPPVHVPDCDLWSVLFDRPDRPFPDAKQLFTDAAAGAEAPPTGRGHRGGYTLGALRSASLGFGRALRGLWDWKKGDVLALYTPNSVDTPVVTLGALWAGAVLSLANPLYTVEELAFQLRDSRARALVTQPPFLKTALEAARKVGIPENRVILLGGLRQDQGEFVHFSSMLTDSDHGNSSSSSSSSDGTGETLEFRSPLPPDVTIDADQDLAFLVYSSGTTGLPKGVCLSHRNIVANIVQTHMMDARYFHHDGGLDGKGDKILGVLPFYHIYGLMCAVLIPIFCGVEVVVMERFDLEAALQAIERHGITYIYVPPPIVLAFSKHPAVDKYDVSTLRTLHSGGAPLTRELAEALWARLKIPVKQGYGMSETSAVVCTQTIDEWAKYIGSVGKLSPSMEAMLVDEAGREVPVGETGELWVKGPNVFKGYLNNPEKTKESFTKDGWFKTGDIFRRDAKGNLYCTDRLKELIKYKGFQVAPAELEGLLVSHPDVVDVCVVGIEDRQQATELPRAYVVLRPGAAAGEDKAHELAGWVARRLAPHKRLRGGVRFVAQVPKSPSGKILRRIVRDQAASEDRRAGAKL